MGLSRPVLEILASEELRAQARGGTVLTLGVQDVVVTRQELLHLLLRCGHRPPAAALDAFSRRPEEQQPQAHEVFDLFGYAAVEALDLLPGEGADIVHDLCQPVPSHLRGKYQLVVDGGTLEHLFDPAAGLRGMIELVAPGGQAFHATPLAGWENHGFWTLQPKLLWRTYLENGFADPRAFLVHLPRRVEDRPWFQRIPGPEAVPLLDALRWRTLLVFAARRARVEGVFRSPIDSHQEPGAPARKEPPIAPRAEPTRPVTISPAFFRPDEGRCYVATLPGDLRDALLLEDGLPLAFADSQHGEIRAEGGGRYSFWPVTTTHLYMSTSDGSDPRTGKRRYAYTPGVRRPPARDDRLAWAEDREFAELCARLRARCGEGPLDRYWNLKELLRSLGRLDGDTAECGVFFGFGSAVIAHYARGLERAPGFRHRCFDSFQGLSAPATEDAPEDGVRPWQAGMMRAPLDAVRENLAEWPEVSFHPGYFPAGFTGQAAEARYAFVHLDVDLHEPTRLALEFFWPRLVPGGLIVCDDDGFLTCPGARRALDEFLRDRPERAVRLSTGQAFLRKLA